MSHVTLNKTKLCLRFEEITLYLEHQHIINLFLVYFVYMQMLKDILTYLCEKAIIFKPSKYIDNKKNSKMFDKYEDFTIQMMVIKWS